MEEENLLFNMVKTPQKFPSNVRSMPIQLAKNFEPFSEVTCIQMAHNHEIWIRMNNIWVVQLQNTGWDEFGRDKWVTS